MKNGRGQNETEIYCFNIRETLLCMVWLLLQIVAFDEFITFDFWVRFQNCCSIGVMNIKAPSDEQVISNNNLTAGNDFKMLVYLSIFLSLNNIVYDDIKSSRFAFNLHYLLSWRLTIDYLKLYFISMSLLWLNLYIFTIL